MHYNWWRLTMNNLINQNVHDAFANMLHPIIIKEPVLIGKIVLMLLLETATFPVFEKASVPSPITNENGIFCKYPSVHTQ